MTKIAAEKLRTSLCISLQDQLQDETTKAIKASFKNYIKILLLNRETEIHQPIKKESQESKIFTKLGKTLKTLKTYQNTVSVFNRITFKLGNIRSEQGRLTLQSKMAEDIGVLMKSEGKLLPDALSYHIPNVCVPNCTVNNKPMGRGKVNEMIACDSVRHKYSVYDKRPDKSMMCELG